MKYKNIKTGAVIETTTEVHGENWQALMPASPPVPEIEAAPEAEEVPEAEVAPVQQKKKAGKGKASG